MKELCLVAHGEQVYRLLDVVEEDDDGGDENDENIIIFFFMYAYDKTRVLSFLGFQINL